MTKSSDVGTALLRVSGLSKSYGARIALEDVSFSVRPGEVLGVIGPNGAGKTTLLECVAGLLPADAGVLLQGDHVVDADVRIRLVFYMPDAITPWPDQPLRWALDFTIGFFRGRADLREEVVRTLELEPLLGAPLGTMSKGERKRALLAVALLAPQPVLLIDEPFDGLDLRQSRQMVETLRSHAARGRTLVVSIHQIAEAARICDRFVLLSAGRVRAEGALRDLVARAEKRRAAIDREGYEEAADLEEVFLALT
jgi:ABC-2 type transport system ATP-binding protein